MSCNSQSLLDNYPGLAIRIDPNSGDVLFIGGLYKTLLLGGLKKAENVTLAQIRSAIIKSDQKKVLETCKKRIADGENWNIEYRVKKNADTIWLREQAQFGKQQDKPVIDLFIHDVTLFKNQHKKLKNEIAEVNKSSGIKNEFFASMSHEIRTPMNAVMGMAQILAKTQMDADQKQYLSTIVNASNALVQIINDILDVSKLEAGKFELLEEEVDLERLCLDVCHLLVIRSDEKQIALNLNFRPVENKIVHGDGGRIRQILINLIGNAIKFTETGSVTLVVELESVNNINHYRFSVKDTGIGIPEEAQQNVFNAFSQVDASITKNFGGTGLGLQICQKLVSLMKGNIGLESELNKGSTFWFSIPMESFDEPPTSYIDFNKKHCLLVDNEPMSFEITKNILESTNLVVTGIKDSEDVLALLTDDKVKLNLIVLKKNLPGLDGLKLAELIKKDKRYSEVPVILLSPLTMKENRKQLMDHGINIYLTPPLTPSLLKIALHALTTIREKIEAVYISSKIIDQMDEDQQQYYFKGAVLIADDVEVNQFILNSMLSQFGIVSDFANNGLEALEKVKKNHYDLVFMDCRMPIMDGFEATEKIRKLSNSKAKIPVIALTANAGKSDEQACLQAGMDGFMTKPYTENEIFRVIKKWIARDEVDSSVISAPEEIMPERVEIDMTQFQAIQASLGEKFPEFASALPDKFKSYQEDIYAALKDGDLTAAGEKAHAFKGIAALIGAVYTSELAQTIESAAEEKDLESINIALSKLNAAIERAESIILENLHPDLSESVILF